ncbi:MAG TPA: hypothetical protein VLI55_16990 [Bryobacteraceae bacterium]|nr:hypothetical protein [Bryobacteraceae bacterium]
MNDKTRSTAARKLIKMSDERRPSPSKAPFVEPMLCLAASSLPEGDEWEYELNSMAIGRWLLDANYFSRRIASTRNVTEVVAVVD